MYPSCAHGLFPTMLCPVFSIESDNQNVNHILAHSQLKRLTFFSRLSLVTTSLTLSNRVLRNSSTPSMNISRALSVQSTIHNQTHWYIIWTGMWRYGMWWCSPWNPFNRSRPVSDLQIISKTTGLRIFVFVCGTPVVKSDVEAAVIGFRSGSLICSRHHFVPGERESVRGSLTNVCEGSSVKIGGSYNLFGKWPNSLPDPRCGHPTFLVRDRFDVSTQPFASQFHFV